MRKQYFPLHQLFFFICLISWGTVSSQVNLPVFWIKKYGGTKADNPISVKATPDGGTVFCGVTKSNDFDVSGLNGIEKDIWVVKVDKNGIIQWQKTYLTIALEDPKELILTSDGGYAVCSWIQVGSFYNTLILKLSSSGTLEWQKQLTSQNAYVNAITQTADGGYAFTGYMNGTPDGEFAGLPTHGFPAELFIAKLNSIGTFLWGKTYGGSQGDIGYMIKQLSDGNLLVGAHTYSNDGDVTGSHNSPVSNGDFWILKLTSSGDTIWKKCFGGSGNEMIRDGFEKANRYYLTGTTNNSSAAPSGDVTAPIDGNDIWYVVLDTAGTLIRQKCIGGTGNADVALSIAPTLDDKIILGGNSNSNNQYVSGNHGQSDYALIKIDTLGNKVWGKLFGNSSNEFGGVQQGARAAVNADTTFSLLAGSLVGGGEIPALYGSDDIIMIRFTDTSLYQDLYSKITFNTNVFKGRPINYKLSFGRNNSVVSSDTIILKFLRDNNLQLTSITRPPTITDGDTLIWKIPKAAVINADTISLTFRLDPALITLPDSVRVRSFIGPYTTEYYQTNNVTYAASKMKNQNAGIINPSISISSSATMNANKATSYGIFYSFQNQLDTLTGIVRMVKDHKTRFITATPMYNTIIGDTMVWNFSVNPGSFNPFINLQLQADTPVVQLGDTIRHFATLQFNTQDTSVVSRTDSIKQAISQICIPPSTVNTTLPPPQGVQWMRAVGGSADDKGIDITAISDSTFVTVGITSSTDGDLAPGPPFENGLITKYTTNGNMIWKKVLGGNGTDRLASVVQGANQSVIIVGHTASNDGIFSTLHTGFGPDVLLSKLDSNGNVVWNKTLGGTNWDGMYAVIRKFRDDRYVVVTKTASTDGDVVNPYPAGSQHLWIFMINEAGTILWQKVHRDTMLYNVLDVQVTLNKEILIAGDRNTTSSFARLIRTDSLGNIKMLKNYEKPNRSLSLKSGVSNSDSTFLFTGQSLWGTATDQYCFGEHPEGEVWLLKLDKSLNVIWEKYFGGDKDESGTHIIKAAEGGYLVCGSAFSNNGNVTGNHDISGSTSEAWLFKIDDNGKLIWQKTVGGDKNDQANRMIQLSNSSIILTGESSTYNNGDIYGSKGALDAILFKIGVTNSVNGMVFLDNNGNHIKEGSEPFVETGFVQSTKGIFTNASNITNGYFATAVDTGTYISRPVISSPYYQPYPVTHTSTFTTFGNRDSVNFGMVPVGAVNDLTITMLPITPARPGFQSVYVIKCENIGTTTIVNGNIKLIKDHRANVVSATLPYTSVIADTIKWDFTSFAPFETKEFMLTLSLAAPPALMINDTLHFKSIINPVVGDSVIINNVSNVDQPVTGSYDPNDKTESHGPGFPVQLLAAGEYLNYTIRFQNTGNDTAFRVLIRDTLDPKLDWSSLQMISASHNYRLTVTNGNILEWKFDPIILPDSTHNEPASHGFVAFRIRPRHDLAAGDTIANRAGIYFDFNPPILTNTEETIIDNGVNNCPGGNKAYWSGIPGAIAYKWQVNNGSSYVDLVNNSLYSGVNADTLRITTPSAAMAGTKYRCMVTTADGIIPAMEYQLKFVVTWTGAVSTAWENSGNWDCGVLPDANTDVVIKHGTVMVNSNREVRSLSVKPGVQFWVNSGSVFSIMH
ncbi:MAG: hypothetical protein JNM19_06050 [Chitinophagaceae bacterium]|nr:hypothetical protein [Chitinophagaceae bacterium]